MSVKTKFIWVSILTISLLFRFGASFTIHNQGIIGSVAEIIAQTLLIVAILILLYDKIFATQYPKILKIRVPFTIFLIIMEALIIFFKIFPIA